MDETPDIAEPGKPCRRWFQFRLRTLLVGVVRLGAACGYVAHDARIVRERNALRLRIERMGAKFTIAAGPSRIWLKLERNPMPFPRNWMGDMRAAGIEIPASFTQEDIAEVRRVFPAQQMGQNYLINSSDPPVRFIPSLSPLIDINTTVFPLPTAGLAFSIAPSKKAPGAYPGALH